MRTSDPECPFCRIVEGEDPDARVIYWDDHVVAFFPDDPATLGHTLVVPRKHIPDIWMIDEVSAMRVASVSVQIADLIRGVLNPQGLNVIQSNGLVATQTVFHLHVHLVPRWEGDEVGSFWPVESSVDEHETQEAWQSLRRACERIVV